MAQQREILSLARGARGEATGVARKVRKRSDSSPLPQGERAQESRKRGDVIENTAETKRR